MGKLVLALALVACDDGSTTDDAGGIGADAAPGGATCSAFCAKSSQCQPGAIDVAVCESGCPAMVPAACRTCVVEQSCEAITAGACDSSCG